MLLGQHRFDRFTLNQIKRDEQIEYVLVGHFCDPDSVQHQFLLARWGGGLKSLQTLLAAKAEAEATQEAETMAETLRKQDQEEREARRVRRAQFWRKGRWVWFVLGVFAFYGFVYWVGMLSVTPRPVIPVNDTLARMLELTMQMVTSLLPHLVMPVVAAAFLFAVMRLR